MTKRCSRSGKKSKDELPAHPKPGRSQSTERLQPGAPKALPAREARPSLDRDLDRVGQLAVIMQGDVVRRPCSIFESRLRGVFWPPENLFIFLVAGAPHRVQSAFAVASGRKFLDGRTSIAPQIDHFIGFAFAAKALNLHRAAVAD